MNSSSLKMLSVTCGTPEDVRACFGDGAFLEGLMLGSGQNPTVDVADIAFQLCCNDPKSVWIVLNGFLEQQNARPTVDFCQRVSLIKECFMRYHEGEGQAVLLQGLATSSSVKPYFDYLFSWGRVADTVNLFLCEADWGEYMFQDVSLELGRVVNAMEDERVCHLIRDILIKYSFREVLNSWLTDPVLGEASYIKLRQAFLKDMQQWEKDCPDFFNMMQKKQISDALDTTERGARALSLGRKM